MNTLVAVLLRASHAVLLAVALLAPNGAAQTFRSYEGVELTLLDPSWPGPAGRGYGELRFRADNASDDARVVEITVGAPDGSSGSMTGVARAVVAPQSTRELVVLLPLFASTPGDYSSVVSSIDGREEFAPVAVDFASGRQPSNGFVVAVFSDRALGGGFAGERSAALSRVFMSRAVGDAATAREHFHEPAPSWYMAPITWRGGSVPTERYREQQVANFRSGLVSREHFVSVHPTAALPSSTHACTSLDALVIDGGPIDPARLDDLARWVRLGGLVVVARADTYSAFGDLDDARREQSLLATFGDAEVRRLGLGTVVFSTADPLASDGQLQALWWVLERAPSWQVPLLEYANASEPPRWHMALPELDGVGELSHHTLLAILLVLTLVMAPLNVWVVRRSKRPAALLVTVPLLSLVGSLGVVGYGIARDGLGVVEGARSWAVLDQETQTASSATARTMFMGSSGGRRLAPGAGTIVLPFTSDVSFGWSLPRHVLAHDLESGDLRFESGWLPVRRTFSHFVLGDRNSRKHVALRREGEALVVENALGANVSELWLRDRAGDLWRTPPGSVAAGASVTLERTADEAALAEFLARLAPGPYMTAFERLAPGCYATAIDQLLAPDDCGVAGKVEVVHQSLIGVLEEEALR
jgi:hypothetical protein